MKLLYVVCILVCLSIVCQVPESAIGSTDPVVYTASDVPENLAGRLLMVSSDNLVELDLTSGSYRTLAENALGFASPDGKTIAYQSAISEDEIDVYLLGADGMSEQWIAALSGISIQLVGWTPSGNRLIFKRNLMVGVSKLYSLALDGSDEQVFLDPVIADGNDREVGGFCFSENGEVVYWASQNGTSASTFEIYSAALVNDAIDETSVVRLTDNGVFDDIDYGAVRSGKIAFHRNVGSPTGVEYREIFVMDGDGSNPIQLTSNSYRDSDALLAPDGETILWRSDSNDNAAIIGRSLSDTTAFTLFDESGTDVPLQWIGESMVPLALRADDVPNDQGRAVRIAFGRCAADVAGSTTPIVQYEFFRRIEIGATAADPLPDSGHTMISEPVKLAGWEFVGAIPAHGETWYNAIVPTLADSTATGTYWSEYVVRAATADPVVYFDSENIAGYSVDNLSPSAPSSFSVAYSLGSNELQWDAVSDADVVGYRICRSSTNSFDPETTIQFETSARWYNDVVSPGWEYYYRVAAFDDAGNESPWVAPGTFSGVEPTTRAVGGLKLSNYPNPFNPVTNIVFEIGESSHVSLEIYDLRGHLLSKLLDGPKLAGTHSVQWSGLDTNNRPVASGVYLAIVKAQGATKSRRLVILE